MKKQKIVLGVDPGIANCGVAVLRRKGSQLDILMHTTYQTDKTLARGHRLYLISKEIECVIQDFAIDLVAVERVFFSKNVSSALDTEAVIAAIEIEAHRACLPCTLLTPQIVKAATGLGGKASKVQVKRMMQKLTGAKFRTHHQADAAAVALAGVLRGA